MWIYAQKAIQNSRTRHNKADLGKARKGFSLPGIIFSLRRDILLHMARKRRKSFALDFLVSFSVYKALKYSKALL